MFGSQALETLIGLALLFFILATATSAVVEIVAKLLKKRHRDLEHAIGSMLRGETVTWGGAESLDPGFRETSVYRAVSAAAGKAGPSYLSARAFADASAELFRFERSVPPGLRAKVEAMRQEVGQDALSIKSGLESWFDETMSALADQYKKWATMWLLLTGLALAAVTNASAIDVTTQLWSDMATRQAVVAAAEGVVDQGQDATTIKDVAQTIDGLTALHLPVGWHCSEASATSAQRNASASSGAEASASWACWPAEGGDRTLWVLWKLIGWFITAALLMLGAPFWFDLLSKLVSLRSGGPAPPKAPDDPASATHALHTRVAAQLPDPGSQAGRRSSRRADSGEAPFQRVEQVSAAGAGPANEGMAPSHPGEQGSAAGQTRRGSVGRTAPGAARGTTRWLAGR